MSAPPGERAFYVTGGTLKPDAPSYVERAADRELWEQLQVGEYCYVLTSRQMGKSSLMARTASRLRAAGDKAAIIDLTQIGSARGESTAESWYLGVLHAVYRGLGLATPLKTWWRANAELSPVQRFVEYFREVALREGEERRVVFVDEIDSTIGLPFGDDFFAAIRACYNARADDEIFERLSFVLLGVAMPDQLIDDPERTPFNVGRRIELADFNFDQARRLAAGLGDELEGGNALAEQQLGRILHWTGGQPYLTQVLCQLVVETERVGEAAIDQIVEDHFFSERALREETHLRHIRARLCGGGRAARPRLKLYQQILRQRAPVADQPTSTVMAALKLSGVVRLRGNGTLAPRNRLYERVFTAAWAHREMPSDRARVVAYGSFSATMATVLVWYALFQPRPYVNQLELAREDFAVAATAYVSLRANPFARFRADELMARFWDRRARKAALAEDRDRTLLAWLQAMRQATSDRRRREAGHWVAGAYDSLRATFRHVGAVNALAFSPDGTTVVTGSDGTARLWSAQTGAAIGQPMQHEDLVLAVAFSPDGSTVVTGSSDGTARLWSAQTGATIGQPMQHEDWVRAVSFSLDGSTVVTGSDDGTARLWSAQTGVAVGQAMQHEDWVRAVAFSPDGTTVVTGSSDGTARLWSAQTGVAIGQPMQHEDSVLSVSFSPDGSTMVTGSSGGTARLWSAQTGGVIGQPMQHEGLVRAVSFSPDGTTVVTGSSDGTARLWGAQTGIAIGQPMQHEDLVLSASFSPDGSTMVTGSDDGTARLWSAQTGVAIGQPMQHEDLVFSVSFSPDGSTVVTGSSDGTARLWSAQTGGVIGQPMQHESLVRAVTFSPDGSTVVTGSDGTARLWSAQTGAAIGQPMQHEFLALAVAFSPDGTTVVTGSDDGTARLWSARTGAAIGQPMQHESLVRAVTFSPDGSTVLTGSSDGTARLWGAQTGAAIGQPMQHESLVLAVSFSPDGSTVVTGSSGGTARLWSAQTGSVIGQPMQHEGLVRAVSFSPDGSTVLTGSSDGTARLWSAQTGVAIGQPMKHEDWVLAVAFSPDGKRALIRTDHRLHVHSRVSGGLDHVASRFIGTGWTGEYRFSEFCADCLEVAVRPTANSLRIDTIHLSEPDAPPIEGDPDELLAEWQRRLALVFDPEMNLVPRFPVVDVSRRDSGPR